MCMGSNSLTKIWQTTIKDITCRLINFPVLDHNIYIFLKKFVFLSLTCFWCHPTNVHFLVVLETTIPFSLLRSLQLQSTTIYCQIRVLSQTRWSDFEEKWFGFSFWIWYAEVWFHILHINCIATLIILLGFKQAHKNKDMLVFLWCS